MGLYLRLGFLALQIINAVIVALLIMHGLSLGPYNLVGYIETSVAAAAVFALFEFLPFGTIIAAGFIFYDWVWNWDFNPFVALLAAMPAIIIFMMFMWTSFSEKHDLRLLK